MRRRRELLAVERVDPGRAADTRRSHRRRGSVMRLATAGYLAAALGIVTGPLVARSLGPTGRGEYAAVLTYSGFAVVLVGLGVTQSINYALQTLKIAPG